METAKLNGSGFGTCCGRLGSLSRGMDTTRLNAFGSGVGRFGSYNSVRVVNVVEADSWVLTVSRARLLQAGTL